MFGFTGADSAETVVRKRGYMADAQVRCPSLLTSMHPPSRTNGSLPQW